MSREDELIFSSCEIISHYFVPYFKTVEPKTTDTLLWPERVAINTKCIRMQFAEREKTTFHSFRTLFAIPGRAFQVPVFVESVWRIAAPFDILMRTRSFLFNGILTFRLDVPFHMNHIQFSRVNADVNTEQNRYCNRWWLTSRSASIYADRKCCSITFTIHFPYIMRAIDVYEHILARKCT